MRCEKCNDGKKNFGHCSTNFVIKRKLILNGYIYIYIYDIFLHVFAHTRHNKTDKLHSMQNGSNGNVNVCRRWWNNFNQSTYLINCI